VTGETRLAEDIELWRQYEFFHLKHCLGLWSPALVTVPFGTLMICHPGDYGSLLWQGDLSKNDFGEIIEATEDTSRRWYGDPGFCISPSWRGDVDGFRNGLSENGYQRQHEILWQVLENLGSVEHMPQSDCTVDQTQDSSAVEAVHLTAFPESAKLSPLVGVHAAHPKTAVKSPFFLARQADGPVGIVAATYEGELGYIQCLGVLPAFRKRGIAKHLVRQALLHMGASGVRRIICAAETTNEESLAVQKRAGYRPFARTEIWTRRDQRKEKK
jgi:ribosomal protein S18 acetylase RimI-like enzyme